MKTLNAKEYLEKHNLTHTYWGKRIISAEKRNKFTHVDRTKAGRWMSCACGKLDKRIPRYKDFDNSPKNSKLRDHGKYFLTCVEGDYFMGAAQNLRTIENMGNKILAKLNK